MKPLALLIAALLLSPGLVAAPDGGNRLPSYKELWAVILAGENRGVSPFRLLLVAYTETGLKMPRRKVGRHGEHGLFQVRESTAEYVGCGKGWNERSREITYPAADCAAIVMSKAKWECRGDAGRALFAYNNGNCLRYWRTPHVRRAMWWKEWLWQRGISEQLTVRG